MATILATSLTAKYNNHIDNYLSNNTILATGIFGNYYFRSDNILTSLYNVGLVLNHVITLRVPAPLL